MDRGRRLAARALTGIGDELRDARLQAGLTQRTVASVSGISHAELSRIERGAARRVPYETLVLVGSALGLDVPLRVYPGADPIRDGAQVALLGRLRATLPKGLRWHSEVPIRAPGDRRAWDAVISDLDWRLPVDAETRLRDVQALSRSKALKLRDDGGGPMILLIAATRHNRQVLRLAREDLAAAFPLAGRLALSGLARGEAPTGSSIVQL
jgi:transcriptional regulator with XRE-family HTH domain